MLKCLLLKHLEGKVMTRCLTGSEAVVLGECCVFGGSSRAALSGRHSCEQQSLPSLSGSAHGRAWLLAPPPAGSYSPQWWHGWAGKALRDPSWAAPQPPTPLCRTCATAGALPFTGRVLCATAARWLQGKTRENGEKEQVTWQTQQRCGLQKAAELEEPPTTAACHRLISNSLFTWLKEGMVFCSLHGVDGMPWQLHSPKITPKPSPCFTHTFPLPALSPHKKPTEQSQDWSGKILESLSYHSQDAWFFAQFSLTC